MENKSYDILEKHLEQVTTKLTEHSTRVADISMNIISIINIINEDEKELVYKAAILHDIAKFDDKNNHNKKAKKVLSKFCGKDEDFENLCLIIKNHKGKFKPDKDIAIMAAILRLADKIDKFNKDEGNAEEKFGKSLKKIKKYFKKNGLKKEFKKIKKACKKVKNEISKKNK